eukprot:CAMPEP_0171980478 /NCGR_PEP_ID=MMETSP0993-20121228/261740_1 /TAXON_ID=483369 /ORGANISM="non described non described, Strain CCMP2098" /LENGTH=119 /DNA_ID=CAMNT_0012632735 /DNA_START=42 /DNA_END=397 /DNA_ORIENTATION=-
MMLLTTLLTLKLALGGAAFSEQVVSLPFRLTNGSTLSLQISDPGVVAQAVQDFVESIGGADTQVECLVSEDVCGHTLGGNNNDNNRGDAGKVVEAAASAAQWPPWQSPAHLPFFSTPPP